MPVVWVEHQLGPRPHEHVLAGAVRQVGKFTLLEHLGAGAFGNVFKARDSELDRIIALKIPRAGKFASQWRSEPSKK